MFKFLVILITVLGIKTTVQVHIIWDNSIEYDFNSFDDFSRVPEVRMPNWIFIYPGTKWCGAGNISDSDTDFGVHRDTDKCCRNHDFCPDTIGGFETKYNLRNPSFYTRVSCDCDLDFYKCLKSVNSRTSTQVGHLYFTILGTQCFKQEYPITGCEKYTYFPKRKCLEYSYDKTQEKIYQWFDLPNY